MKFHAILFSLLLLAPPAVGADVPVQILVNPGPFADIATAADGEERVNFWDNDPSDDDACTESYAAVELQRFLTLVPGLEQATIRLGRDQELPTTGYVFVLGNRRSNPLVGCLDGVGEKGPKLTSPESYRLRVVPQGARTVCVIEGGGRVGTLYGVYDYLERLGYRFFGLGEQGTVRPAQACELIRKLEAIETPSFVTRGFHAWEPRGNDDFFAWMARNRLNLWTAAETKLPLLKKLGLKLAIGSHDVQTNFLNPKAEYPYRPAGSTAASEKPADPYRPSPESPGDADHDGTLTYFEAHPEWFGLRDGHRSDKLQGARGDNFCTSNDDATAELAKNFVQGIVDGKWSKADVVNFWMEDDGHWCECERCQRLGNPADRLLALVYRVNQEVQKARHDGRLHRDVHLTTLAYTETLPPPTRPLPADFDYENCSVTFYPIDRCYAHALADPTCTEINHSFLQAYQGWSPHEGGPYRGTLFLGEYYNVSYFKSLPVLYTQILATDIPWYYQTGVRHLQYMHTLTKSWGTWTLNQYLFARLLWNPRVEVPSLLDDYFRNFYPTSSDHTRRFYVHLEDAFRNITCLKTQLSSHLKKNEDPFLLNHFHYEPHQPASDAGPSFLETLDALALARREIDAALLECQDPIEQARLLEDERRFSYGEDMVDFYHHLVRTAMFESAANETLARHEFAKAEQAAARLRRYGREFIETCANSDDGFAASQVRPRYYALKKKYGDENAP